MSINRLGRAFPDSGFAQFLSRMLDHVPWVGVVPWDLIQPAFMFMVGVSLPFSIASRRAKGQSFARMFGHSVYRALALIALGIFLRSQQRAQTYFTFEDVLTQIGLGYVFLFLLGWARPKVQWAAAIAILVGLLGGVRALSTPARRFRYDDGRCADGLAAQADRLRAALGQEHELRATLPTSGS